MNRILSKYYVLLTSLTMFLDEKSIWILQLKFGIIFNLCWICLKGVILSTKMITMIVYISESSQIDEKCHWGTFFWIFRKLKQNNINFLLAKRMSSFHKLCQSIQSPSSLTLLVRIWITRNWPKKPRETLKFFSFWRQIQNFKSWKLGMV